MTFALVLAFPLASYTALGDYTRVSVAMDGTQGNNGSDDLANSANGHFLVFDSYAENHVNGNTNGHVGLFCHYTQALQTTCVSIACPALQDLIPFSFQTLSNY